MIFCRGCGKELHESALQCPHCGAPQNTSLVTSANHWSSITSLIFGVIAFFLILMEPDGTWDSDTVLGAIFFGIIPVVFSLVSFAKKPKSGMWMSVTGLILGVLVILVALGSM